MKNKSNLSKLLAAVLTICMVISALPIVASATATMQYINIEEIDGEMDVYFSDSPGDASFGVYFNGSSTDSYTLTQDLSGYEAVVINDIELIIGQGGAVNEEGIITAGAGHVVEGNISISTPGIDRCEANDAMSVIMHFSDFSPHITLTVNGDATLSTDFGARDLIVENGTLTISSILWFKNVTVESGAEIYIQAPQDGEDPNGLNIDYVGSLLVEDGGEISADEGQILRIDSYATASGIDLYTYNGANVESFTLEAIHEDAYVFEYHDSRWVLPQEYNGGDSSSTFMVFARDLYEVEYGGGYLGVIRSSDENEEEVSFYSGMREEYTGGETLSFFSIAPEDEENLLVSYTVYDIVNDTHETFYASYDSNTEEYYFDIDTSDYSGGLLVIVIAWSQEGYNFDVVNFTSGIRTQIFKYGQIDGASVSTVNSTMESTYRNVTKAQFADGTTQIEYHIYAGERKYLSYIQCDLGELTLETLESGDLPDGYSFTHGAEYDIFIMPVDDPDTEYTLGFNFEKVPGYHVYFNDTEFSVSASDGNDTVSIFDDTIYDYPDADSLILTFTQLDQEVDFYGLILWYEDADNQDQYIKADDLLNGNQLEITDFDKIVSISVVTWATPFDGEIMVVYDEEFGDVYIEGNRVSSNEIIECELNEIYFLQFTSSKGIYKVEMKFNGSFEADDITSDIVSSYYQFWTGDSNGVTFRVYWTEEEYVFDHLWAYDDQTIITAYYEGNGSLAITCDDEVGNACYNNTYRIVVEDSYTEYRIEFYPEDGAHVESVWIDGVDYSDRVVNDVLTVERGENNNVIFISVTMSLLDDLFDLDGNGVLDANDYALLRGYVECRNDNSGFDMNQADFNKDGAVDGYDVIFLDLYRNRIIDIYGETK